MGANASFPGGVGDHRTSSSSTPATSALPLRATTIGRYAHHVFLPSPETDVITRDKKKKSSKLATLRKKLIRARRHSRSFDHARAIRELTTGWTIRELNALVEEYEASIALKELHILANLARPHANSFKQDLSNLYDYKYCTDVDLIYYGACFPAHRAILSVRCAFFRNLLARYPDYGTHVPVHIRTPGVDVHMFSAVLRYLYTGEFCAEDSKFEGNYEVLVRLGEEFGIPNPLEYDLRTLLETGDYSDAVLVFAGDMESQDSPATPDSSQGGSTEQSQVPGPSTTDTTRTTKTPELRCHKAILAARSPFFRNLLLRRAKSGEELTDHALRSASCIVLDESVIPKQYASVLLHAVYLDSVDLSHIVQNSNSTCSLSEVQAMVAGRGHITHVDEAMEIYHIGQFLDFSMLAQGK